MNNHTPTFTCSWNSIQFSFQNVDLVLESLSWTYISHVNPTVGQVVPDNQKCALTDRPSVNSELHYSEVRGGAELAGDQDTSSFRYAADGLLSEQCVWRPFCAPVGPLFGSSSVTAVPCCETLTTLILNWEKLLYRRIRRKHRGRVGRDECYSDLWDLTVFWLFNQQQICWRIVYCHSRMFQFTKTNISGEFKWITSWNDLFISQVIEPHLFCSDTLI